MAQLEKGMRIFTPRVKYAQVKCKSCNKFLERSRTFCDRECMLDYNSKLSKKLDKIYEFRLEMAKKEVSRAVESMYNVHGIPCTVTTK